MIPATFDLDAFIQRRVTQRDRSLFADDLRQTERAKITCGGAHFQALAVGEQPAQYMVARSFDDVVTVVEKADGFPATDALRYLSHYGIHAELHERTVSGGLTIEEALEDAAVELKADWVVMGAFGHSRLRETLFGGVTRYFINSARFPLLLVH